MTTCGACWSISAREWSLTLSLRPREAGVTKVIRPPHDYGVAIVLLTVAEHLVPPEQLAPLRDAVRRFLWASYLDGVDKPQAEREFAALRELAPTLPEPSATLLGYVNSRDVAQLGPRLLPYIGLYVDAPALSPSRSPEPSAPVFLLHGRDDNVIPAAESQHMADRLRGHAPVRLLLTDLISHAAADQPAHVTDVLRLAGFWGDFSNDEGPSYLPRDGTRAARKPARLPRDAGRPCAGMLTRHDMLRGFAKGGPQSRVADAMERDVQIVDPHDMLDARVGPTRCRPILHGAGCARWPAHRPAHDGGCG